MSESLGIVRLLYALLTEPLSKLRELLSVMLWV